MLYNQSMFIDTHAHLCDEAFDDCRDELVSGLKDCGVEAVVEIGCDFDESRAALAFAKANENIYCAIGVHPHNAKFYSAEFEDWAQKNAKDKKVVAIGEVGLDYYYTLSEKDVQREVFIKQIELSHRLGLPLVVHSRDAEADTIEILLANKHMLTNGVLIHCFCYGVEFVDAVSELSPIYALGGAITFKKNDYSKVIERVGLSNIMLETDCPYLSPEPFRGKVNRPERVAIVASKIASILGCDTSEVESATTANAKRFYGI